MTDPRKDLVNLKAVPPQLNHRRSASLQQVSSIIRKSKSKVDISTLYPSMYTNHAANEHAAGTQRINVSLNVSKQSSTTNATNGHAEHKQSERVPHGAPLPPQTLNSKAKSQPITQTNGDTYNTINSRLSNFTPSNMNQAFHPQSDATGEGDTLDNAD